MTAVATPSTAAAMPVTVIEPARRWNGPALREVWRYRDLFTLLVRRDLVARYRQSVAGVGWVLIRPLVSVAIFTFIFGRVVKVPTDGSPYALFAFCGLLPWMYFAGTVGAATQSVTGSSHLISKVYFPRVILPLVSVVTGMLEMGIQFLALLGLMAWYGVGPGSAFALAPVFALLAGVTALAIGLWLTALNVKYRDVGQAVPFLVQAWMWLCPIIYPSSAIPEHLRAIYALNPMVGVIEGFRWSVLGAAAPDWTVLAVSATVTLLLLASGLVYFRRTEIRFADII